jgi:hypothetical protein
MRIRIGESWVVVIGKYGIISAITRIVFFGSTDQKAHPAVKFCKRTKNIIVDTKTNSKEIEKT